MRKLKTSKYMTEIEHYGANGIGELIVTALFVGATIMTVVLNAI